jgi:hypothetical protein
MDNTKFYLCSAINRERRDFIIFTKIFREIDNAKKVLELMIQEKGLYYEYTMSIIDIFEDSNVTLKDLIEDKLQIKND